MNETKEDRRRYVAKVSDKEKELSLSALRLLEYLTRKRI